MDRIRPVLLVLVSVLFASPALANDPPEIISVTEVQRDPGESIFLNVGTFDPDGDFVTLSAANLPDGSRFFVDGNGSGTLYWSTGADDEGFYLVTFIATDDGSPMLTTTLDVAITIGDPNLPPVLDPIGDQMATVGMSLVVPISATDPDGDPLVISMSPSLDGAVLLDGADGTATFEYTPGPGAVGNQMVTFMVSDGVATDEETVAITVGDVNVPPTLAPIGDRTVMEGETLDIALAAEDPDGDGLTFGTDGLPEGITLDDFGDGTGRLAGSSAAVGIHAVTVVVTDDGVPSESAGETFALEVRPLPEETDLVIVEARWRRGRTRIVGEGAMPGATVELHDAMTGARLGTTTANPEGVFMTRLRAFVQPCSVEARSEGDVSPAVEVEDAPRRCGVAPPVRILSASWKCRGSLYVVGHGVPPRAAVRFYDAESLALLGSTHANRRGKFQLRSDLAERPASIRIGVESGGVEWMLEPVAVHRTGRCNEAPLRSSRH